MYVPLKMARPQDAVDLHLSYWLWATTDNAIPVTAGFFQAFDASTKQIAKNERQLREIAELMADEVWKAKTLFVSPDVCDLTAQMAASMPPDLLQEELVPYPTGFMILGSPWDYMNMDGDTFDGVLPIRAIWWRIHPVKQPFPKGSIDYKPGIELRLFTDDLWALDANGGAEGLLPFGPLIMTDLHAWTFDTWWEDVQPGDQTSQHHQTVHVGQIRRNLLALWRFMQEEIRPSHHPLPRSTRRRLQRAEMPGDGTVAVMHLRKYAPDGSDPDSHTKVDWSHRWWVRGHWAAHPITKEKTVWKPPHLKPKRADLPIVIKPHVTSVDR